MQKYVGISIFFLFICIVAIRSLMLKKQNIEAIEFGKKDRKDFIIIPFAIFYVLVLLANSFNFSFVPTYLLFQSNGLSWFGVALCLLALFCFIWTMISFKTSFRVGLVDNSSQGLITSGTFAISRNPIYVCFAMMLIGQFLVFPDLILLIYIFLGAAIFHRQVLKEEVFLRNTYGKEFEIYSKKVRRYL